MPSPAALIATCALLVSLGGSGYAISQLPRNSLGPAQLKTGVVTSAKVRNGTLRAEDFRQGTLLQGPRGQDGPRGAAGTSNGGSQVAALSIRGGELARVVMPGDWERPALSAEGDGIHRLTFDRSLAGCTAVAVAGFDEVASAPRLATVDRPDGAGRSLRVRISDAEGFPVDGDEVGVMVACPG